MALGSKQGNSTEETAQLNQQIINRNTQKEISAT
jgi:hypothetical protein